MGCTVETVTNRTKGFEFAGLYDVYSYLNETCKQDSEVFFPGTRLLTNDVCLRITGVSDDIWTGWTAYPIADAWNRIVVWKMPLIQLLSQFPRPPLGWTVECGVMLHLLGDPTDSIASMLSTLANCQRRVQEAKTLCSRPGRDEKGKRYERKWKALAIIMVSYEECGASHKLGNFCQVYGRTHLDPNFDTEMWPIYRDAAAALAADRQTRTLPVFLAESIFIGGWVISLIKAASTEPNPTNWVNVEAQSIAISALYLWAISTVVIGSLIGASQTEDSIPRILTAFEERLYAASHPKGDEAYLLLAQPDKDWYLRGSARATHGGTYSWRPQKWRSDGSTNAASCAIYSITAILVVGSSLITAAITSYLVSPRGLSCRHIVETIVFAIWLGSFIIETLCERISVPKIFGIVFYKDFFCATANIVIVIMVQLGIMNRCSCWSMWGATGVHLPQIPVVKEELMYFITQTAPWIVYTALGLQFMFCAGIVVKYRDAVRVFIQRDDGKPNLAWSSSKEEA